ncbi:hypothetical protein NQ318_016154 [Aromia moschata]|uniref:Transposase n=1 Tax=Aromia moschata TaxID=1265417 RepID=A0AAV8X6R3_9CUCU|nr:hypothetical protein NQ318_016154 [Aromia moschata]
MVQNLKLQYPISGPILQAKADDFARQLSGEAADVPEGVCNYWLTTVWPNLRKGYKDEKIFNTDETGLFFIMLPDKTMKFKGEKCVGCKLSKERSTFLVATNMTGSEKVKLVIITHPNIQNLKAIKRVFLSKYPASSSNNGPRCNTVSKNTF